MEDDELKRILRRQYKRMLVPPAILQLSQVSKPQRKPVTKFSSRKEICDKAMSNVSVACVRKFHEALNTPRKDLTVLAADSC
jgi:hypothetical protein